MFEDDIFNEVLCLGGPFSHILQTAEYQTAISELIRVAKPGAPIISDSDEICSPCLSMVCFFLRSPLQGNAPE